MPDALHPDYPAYVYAQTYEGDFALYGGPYGDWAAMDAACVEVQEKLDRVFSVETFPAGGAVAATIPYAESAFFRENP